MLQILEAVFAIIGVFATLAFVAIAIFGESLVKWLEAKTEEVMARTEEARRTKEEVTND